MGAYRCVICGTKGGTLDLYARLRHGTTHVKGPNGNGKELADELREELGRPAYRTTAYTYRAVNTMKVVEYARADDEAVSNTYEKLLSLPCFALTEQHEKNLLARGLSPDAIIGNGYRSFTMEGARVLVTPKVREVYAREMRTTVRKDPVYASMLERFSDEQLMVGLALANVMLQTKCRMDGVPGFFKLKKRWCFVFDTGLCVPTRNVYGKIVSLQLRRDSGRLRYMTVSSKGLPRGVTSHISRAHFCKANTPIGPDTKVMLTEGPLKADAALDMLQRRGRNDVAFIALHGVNNTADLPDIFHDLKELGGVKVIYNLLDMDKITNIHVCRASEQIRTLVREADLAMQTVFWDRKTAGRKYDEWLALCAQHGIPETELPRDENIFVRLGRTTLLLEEHGIRLSADVRGWAGATKGIDDFLLSCRPNGTV